MTVCPVNAIGVDEATGAKVVSDELCIGCGLCTIACPFGTVFALPHTGQATKCHLCGGQPACVVVCPTRAIEFAEVERSGEWFEDWGERVHERFVEALAGASG